MLYTLGCMKRPARDWSLGCRQGGWVRRGGFSVKVKYGELCLGVGVKCDGSVVGSIGNLESAG